MPIKVLLPVPVLAFSVFVGDVAIAAGGGNGVAPPPLPADVLQACMLGRVKMKVGDWGYLCGGRVLCRRSPHALVRALGRDARRVAQALGGCGEHPLHLVDLQVFQVGAVLVGLRRSLSPCWPYLLDMLHIYEVTFVQV